MSTQRLAKQGVYEELFQHSPVPLNPGDICTHMVLFTGEHELGKAQNFLKALCVGLEIPCQLSSEREFQSQTEDLSFKWERHTEFQSFTFYVPNRSQNFEINALRTLPQSWLNEIEKALIVSLHIKIDPVNKRILDNPVCPMGFDISPVAGGSVCDHHAAIWSDFRLYQDGFSRIIIQDSGLGPFRLGRLAQRLIDLETYRILALFGFRTTHHTNEKIAEFEAELLEIINAQAIETDNIQDQDALNALLKLASKIENLVTKDCNRYDATKAYAQIVYKRLDELNEQRIQGAQRLSNFLRRRFIPAMNTCVATSVRLEKLERRITRTASLMRTKIDVEVQQQNCLLLDSMNKRSITQIKLQQTVETLSIFAISYYAIGVFSVFANLVHELGVNVKPEILTGLTAPIIITSIFFAARSIRKKLGLQHHAILGETI